MTTQLSAFEKWASGNTLPDISKTDYLQTEPDQSENINKRIDENIIDAGKMFDDLIQISNERHEKGTLSKQLQTLNEFLNKDDGIVQWYKDRKASFDLMELHYNPDQYESMLEYSTETDMLEAHEDSQFKQAYSAAGELDSQGIEPDLAHALKMSKGNSIQQKEALKLLLSQQDLWLQKSIPNLKVQLEDGRLITLESAADSREINIASREQDERLIQSLMGSGMSPRFIRKYLIPELYKRHEARVLKYVEAKTKAQIVLQQESRQTDLLTNVELTGGEAFLKYINTYAGAHEENRLITRAEAVNYLVDGLKTDQIDGDDIDKVLDYEFTPDGWPVGKTTTIREHWKRDAATLIQAKRTWMTDRLQAKEDEENIKKLNFRDEALSGIRDSKQPPSEKDLFTLQQDHISQFGTRAKWIDDYLSKEDIDDFDIENDLLRRWRNGEEIRPQDIDGISDAVKWDTWRSRVNSGGLSEQDIKDRNEWLTGQVNAYTLEEDADKAKTEKWIAVKQQARDYYNSIYRSERAAGQDHETALSVARQKTAVEIKKGNFDTLPDIRHDVAESRGLWAAKEAISKDPTLLISNQPWFGEELHLKEALKYYKTGQGNVPEYYYNFDLKNITPYELMRSRLISTGLIKEDGSLIPERENLDEQSQNLLLNKPSASNTLQVIENNNKDVEWMFNTLKNKDLDSVDELIAVLRSKANRFNHLNSANANWLRLVQINQADLDAYYSLVGEVPPYLRLENLTPGVAKALLEDTLINN